MVSRKELQLNLNTNRKVWGRGNLGNVVNIWAVEPGSVDEEAVIVAGEGHACTVIKAVLDKSTPLVDNWRSYVGKNNAYKEIGDLFSQVGRVDLRQQWQHGELRGKKEKSHWDLRKEMQYPQGVDPHVLVAVSRLPAFYLADFFKNLDHIVHGQYPKMPVATEDMSMFDLHPSDFSAEALTATDTTDFCIQVALKAAMILKDRGVSPKQINQLLVTSFAKTGLIREYGQQKKAERIVDCITKAIVASGQLPGLVKEFRQKARQNVRLDYHGRPNPDLHKKH